MFLKTFSAVFFAHHIAQVLISLNSRGCGFESQRKLFLYVSIFKNQFNSLLKKNSFLHELILDTE